MANLTTNEAIALNTMIDGVCDFPREMILEMAIGKIEEDPMFEGNVNETEIEDIAGACGISVNATKGVLGSLGKKGYAWLDEDDGMLCPTMDGVKALIEDVKNFK